MPRAWLGFDGLRPGRSGLYGTPRPLFQLGPEGFREVRGLMTRSRLEFDAIGRTCPRLRGSPPRLLVDHGPRSLLLLRGSLIALCGGQRSRGRDRAGVGNPYLGSTTATTYLLADQLGLSCIPPATFPTLEFQAIDRPRGDSAVCISFNRFHRRGDQNRPSAAVAIDRPANPSPFGFIGPRAVSTSEVERHGSGFPGTSVAVPLIERQEWEVNEVIRFQQARAQKINETSQKYECSQKNRRSASHDSSEEPGSARVLGVPLKSLRPIFC